MERYHITLVAPTDAAPVLTLLESLGAKNIKQRPFFPLLVTAELPKENLEQVQRHPGVDSIEVDSTVEHHAVQMLDHNSNWGLDRIDQRSATLNNRFHRLKDGHLGGTPEMYRNADRVNIFVVDSGVLDTHEELRDNLGIMYRYAGSPEFTAAWNPTGQLQQMHRLSYDAFRELGDPQYAWPSAEGQFIAIREEATHADACPALPPGYVWQRKPDHHGTHVAAIAAGKTKGVAPGARIVPVRVFQSNTTTTVDILLDAAAWIIQKHQELGTPGIVNMSLGGGRTSMFDLILKAFAQYGLITIVSAGNNGIDAFNVSPAGNGSSRHWVNPDGSPHVTQNPPPSYELRTVTTMDYSFKPIVVGATNKPVRVNPLNDFKDHAAGYSNWGNVVDIWAPGSDIRSAGVALLPYTQNDPCQILHDFSNTSVTVVESGTSMACPMVSGVAALYLQDEPTLTLQQMRTRLQERATVGAVRFDLLNLPTAQNDRPKDTSHILYVDKPEIHKGDFVSPNLLLNSWFYETDLQWVSKPEDFVIKADELALTDVPLFARSLTPNGDQEKVLFSLVPTAPFSIDVHNIDLAEHAVSGDNSNINNAILRIEAGSVTVDTNLSTFQIVATDGRKTIQHDVKVTIRNLVEHPTWHTPDAGVIATIKRGDFIWTTGYPPSPMPINAVEVPELSASVSDGAEVTYTLNTSSDTLPPGLILNGTKFSGVIGAISKNSDGSPRRFTFTIRATTAAGGLRDRSFTFLSPAQNELHRFLPSWLSTLFPSSVGSNIIRRLDNIVIGNNINQRIEMDNPDRDPLQYRIIAVPNLTLTPNTYNGVLPLGFKVQNGSIIGSAGDATLPGTYYFRMAVSDPSGYTVYENFYIIITAGISPQTPVTNNTILWETPAGNIGHIYETQPSHCQVVARATGSAPPVPGDADPVVIVAGSIIPGTPAVELFQPGEKLSFKIDSLDPVVFEFTQGEYTGPNISIPLTASDTIITIENVLAQITNSWRKVDEFTFREKSETAVIKLTQGLVYVSLGANTLSKLTVASTASALDLPNETYYPRIIERPAKITYSLRIGAGTLPEGLILDSDTGMISGFAPFVSGDYRYDFTVIARSGSAMAERDFSITIRDMHRTANIVNVYANITGWDRLAINDWNWITQRVPDDTVFHLGDPLLGRVRFPSMYVVAGLNFYQRDMEFFHEKLKDYHQPMNLRLGQIRSAIAKDPAGTHVYDVVYFDVIDPMKGAGGFDVLGHEYAVTMPDTARPLPEIPTMNIAENTRTFYPNSLDNIRKDFINTQNRIDRVDAEGNVLEPANQRGFGLDWNEGLPLWMRTPQIEGKPSSAPGFTPAVIIAYVRAGLGKQVAAGLDLEGINEALSGRTIVVDRYFAKGLEARVTTFFDIGMSYHWVGWKYDENNFPVPSGQVDQFGSSIPETQTHWSAGAETVFDDTSRSFGPDDMKVLPGDDPLNQPSLFDFITIETGKYQKFPPGDK